jgi:hypothetical protein
VVKRRTTKNNTRMIQHHSCFTKTQEAKHNSGRVLLLLE